MKKITILLLFVALVVSTVIKILVVKDYNFPFTMDQGRDMVDIRQMVTSHTPRLVGPTTSINGVLLGPFWYYFNLPPFLIGQGDPSFVMIWQIVWYQLGAVFIWWVLRKHHPTTAFITSFMLLLSPNSFYTGRYFWNANAMPIATMFFVGCFILSVEKPTRLKSLLTGFVAGLSFQVEAAFGVIFFPFAFLYFLLTKKGFKNLIFLSLGFLVTLLPQAFFELRHQFIMTKIFLAEFTGKGQMLGDKLSLTQRFADRWDLLNQQIVFMSHIPALYIKLVFLIALILSVFIIFKKTKDNNLTRVSLIFLVFIGLFYLLFSQKLKNWYILGLSVPLTIFLSSVLAHYFKQKLALGKLLVTIFLLGHFIYALIAQNQYINEVTSKPSNDPSNLKNEMVSIDWVYKNADGEAFNAYNYIPSVYDYSYNYLYWWYGTKKYGFQPSDTAYLPGQPEYIVQNPNLWTKRKTASLSDPTYLIIETDNEMPQRQQGWIGHFSYLCLSKQQVFPWHIEVRELVKCPTK